jgi:hypothetical protein
MAEEEVMSEETNKNTDPHLNPLPQGEEAAKRQVRVA